MNAKSHLHTSAAVAIILLTAACEYVRAADVDKISGPVGGSVTGSEALSQDQDPAVIGRLLGQMSGVTINNALDDKDLGIMSALALSVLNHGADDRIETWRNGRSRHHGSFVAMSTWSTPDRIECRRFTNTIHVGKAESRATGTACRQRDGTWTIMG